MTIVKYSQFAHEPAVACCFQRGAMQLFPKLGQISNSESNVDLKNNNTSISGLIRGMFGAFSRSQPQNKETLKRTRIDDDEKDDHELFSDKNGSKAPKLMATNALSSSTPNSQFSQNLPLHMNSTENYFKQGRPAYATALTPSASRTLPTEVPAIFRSATDAAAATLDSNITIQPTRIAPSGLLYGTAGGIPRHQAISRRAPHAPVPSSSGVQNREYPPVASPSASLRLAPSVPSPASSLRHNEMSATSMSRPQPPAPRGMVLHLSANVRAPSAPSFNISSDLPPPRTSGLARRSGALVRRRLTTLLSASGDTTGSNIVTSPEAHTASPMFAAGQEPLIPPSPTFTLQKSTPASPPTLHLKAGECSNSAASAVLSLEQSSSLNKTIDSDKQKSASSNESAADVPKEKEKEKEASSNLSTTQETKEVTPSISLFGENKLADVDTSKKNPSASLFDASSTTSKVSAALNEEAVSTSLFGEVPRKAANEEKATTEVSKSITPPIEVPSSSTTSLFGQTKGQVETPSLSMPVSSSLFGLSSSTSSATNTTSLGIATPSSRDNKSSVSQPSPSQISSLFPPASSATANAPSSLFGSLSSTATASKPTEEKSANNSNLVTPIASGGTGLFSAAQSAPQSASIFASLAVPSVNSSSSTITLPPSSGNVVTSSLFGAASSAPNASSSTSAPPPTSLFAQAPTPPLSSSSSTTPTISVSAVSAAQHMSSTSIFGAPSSNSNSSSIFGGSSSTPFTAKSSIFGGGATNSSLGGDSTLIATQPSNQPTSIFGGSSTLLGTNASTAGAISQLAPTSAATGSIFGAAATSSSPFGVGGGSSSATFGSGNTPVKASVGIFGDTASAISSNSGSSIFGGGGGVNSSFAAPSASMASCSSIFGGAPTQTSANPTSSIFGANPSLTAPSSSSIFGGAATTNSLAAAPSGGPIAGGSTSIFGAVATPGFSGSIFGSSSTPNTTTAPVSSIFGNSAAPSTSIFGGNALSSSVPANSMTGGAGSAFFGGGSGSGLSSNSTSGIFGAPASSSSIFGGGSAPAAGGGSIFGNATALAANPPATGIWGASSQPSGGSIFGSGGASTGQPAASGGSIFGSAGGASNGVWGSSQQGATNSLFRR